MTLQEINEMIDKHLAKKPKSYTRIFLREVVDCQLCPALITYPPMLPDTFDCYPRATSDTTTNDPDDKRPDWCPLGTHDKE